MTPGKKNDVEIKLRLNISNKIYLRLKMVTVMIHIQFSGFCQI